MFPTYLLPDVDILPSCEITDIRPKRTFFVALDLRPARKRQHARASIKRGNTVRDLPR